MSYPPQPPQPPSGSEPPYGPPPGAPAGGPAASQPEQPTQPLPGGPPPGWPQPGGPQQPVGQPGWGAPPPGQPPAGWPPQGGYPPAYPGYPVYVARPDHPQASTAMVLGIVGLVVCGGFLSPWAWSKGRRAMREIDAAGGMWGGRGQAQAGYILGIVGTVVLCLTVLYLVLMAVVVIVGLASETSGGGY